MSSMFEFLMDLPLFQGVSRSKLAEVVGSARLHFLKYQKGETIINSGEACTNLTFIISGNARVKVVNKCSSFSIEHTLSSPTVLALDFLFGRHTDSPYSVEAVDNVSVLRISKSDYLDILESDRVFLFNCLNALSVDAQKSIEEVMLLTDSDVTKRIAILVSTQTVVNSTDIIMRSIDNSLAKVFGIEPSNFEKSLLPLIEQGIIEYADNVLKINDRAALLSLLSR